MHERVKEGNVNSFWIKIEFENSSSLADVECHFAIINPHNMLFYDHENNNSVQK